MLSMSTVWYKCFLIILISTSVTTVTKIKARERLKCQSNGRRRSVHEAPSIRHALDYQNNVELVPQIEKKNCQGNTVIKFKENVDGKNIYDASVTVTFNKDMGGVDATGDLYEDINMDELKERQKITAPNALEIAINHNNDSHSSISRVSQILDVFLDVNLKSYLAFFINYISVSNGEPKRPFAVVDAHNGSVLFALDILDTCKSSLKAYGGNTKIGRIDYGKAPKCLKLRRQGKFCHLENKFVRVIDMNSSMNDNITKAAKFLCKKTYNDSVNGAYSPAMDALFYGTAIVRMFTDWYQGTPLNKRILLRVHYSANFTDAFWDGKYCTFGDGSASIYPMVSLDIVGHEIGHSITEQFSNLLYMGESGGINEAFSDMTGEVAEDYIDKADWMVGFSITRDEHAIRYFSNPFKDNASITHIRDYIDGMDAHISSGIYRRVFYILVNQFSIPIRKVYQVFLFANQMYWHKMTTFVGGACDVLRAALDLGSPVDVYSNAFQLVGITACDVNDHIFWLRDGEEYSGIYVSVDTQPIFGFSSPAWAGSIKIKTTSVLPVNITLYNAGSLSRGNYYVLKSGRKELTFSLSEHKNTNFFIHLSSQTRYMIDNVVLVASYGCVKNYTKHHYFDYLNYMKDCMGNNGRKT
ncbi:elastase [Patella vulgata]|uniref:elastase n=1 Tax=Patella vulgata TaxID=6465 RepID=UPI00217F7A86|nr:elastase [Patella vulgata]